jgi:CBS domain-containing protein
VALAGPAVNVVLAGAIFVGLTLAHQLVAIGDTVRVGGSFLNQMLWVNVSLAVFNLLPAFPMDGGRVLRALLAMRFNYVRATQVAATIGQGMAMLFGFVGLVSHNPFMVFIALFVWMGAAQEASMAQMRSAMDGIPVMNAMITNFRSLSSNESLRSALEYVLAGFHQDFPVVDGDHLVGVLTRHDLMVALQRRGPDTPVADVMRRDFVTVDPKDMLPTAFAKLQTCRCHSLPVVENGRLLGLLTSESLAEVLMIQEAMAAERESQGRFPSQGQPGPYGQPFFWKRAHR